MKSLPLSAPILTILFGFVWAVPAQTQQPPEPLRFMLYGGASHELPSEEYLKFVEHVRPQLLLMGVFDTRLYALAGPVGKDQKPRPPLDLRTHLARWKEVIHRLHQQRIQVIGLMELLTVTDRPADLDEETGWVGFYQRAWDERLLGKRPTTTARELLEQPDVAEAGKPATDAVARCGCRVNTRALRGCAANPHWREVQKRMVQVALDLGVDGFITNRNYYGHCTCPHCGAGLQRWLRDRYPTAEDRSRVGLGQLLPAELRCVLGAHREHETTPTAVLLEKQRFAHHLVRECFDEVYLRFGRSRRPGMFAGQWNHMAYFDELHLDRGHLPPATRTNFAHVSADERWSLPADLWGKEENLIWYCNWGTTQNTILAKEYAGDTTLYGKLIRNLAAGKPYVVNKYDFYRPRVMMAEAAALGYTTNAIATPWNTPEDRDVVLRYFAFLRRLSDWYHPVETYAETALIFPQLALHAGDASPLEYVEAAGRALVRRHYLFDILSDERLAESALERYRTLIVPSPEYLPAPARQALQRFVQRGGKVLLTPVSAEDKKRPGAACASALELTRHAPAFTLPARSIPAIRTHPTALVTALEESCGKNNLSTIIAPWTVQFHAYRQTTGNRALILHLVNYHHEEKAPGKSVVARESPLATAPVLVRLKLPADLKAQRVSFESPDAERSEKLRFEQRGQTLEFTTPRFLVYGVCRIEG